MEAMTDLFSWPSKSLCMVIMKLKMLAPWKESYDKARQHIEKKRHHFANKGLSMVFPVVMYGCESWTTKKAEC